MFFFFLHSFIDLDTNNFCSGGGTLAQVATWVHQQRTIFFIIIQIFFRYIMICVGNKIRYMKVSG